MRRLLAVLVISSAAFAQTTPAPLVVDAATAQQHILHQYEPTYPPIAIAAHVTGEVKLQFEIDTQGHVVGLRVVSGPPMLAGAALDAVRHWEYTPFQSDGHAVPVLTVAVVTFPSRLSKGSKLPEPVHIDMDDCTQALKDEKHPEKAIKPCDHAAAQAGKNPPSIRFEFSHTALESAAIADVHAAHTAEALSYLDTLVSWIDESHSDDFAEISNVYSLRAQVRSVSGNAAGAEQDAAIAEDMLRKALGMDDAMNKALKVSVEGNTLQTSYINLRATYIARLRETLKLHATLLAAIGKKDEAQAKLDEAAKLN